MTACRRHEWGRGYRQVEVPVIDGVATLPDGRTVNSTANILTYPEPIDAFICGKCGATKDPVRSKRGRNNRKRGNSHELSVARKYGGEKVGQLGLPEDIRGDEYRTQVKTHQRPAPAKWRKAFTALEAAQDGRTPRLIVRFTQPGVPADDYIIIRGNAWLDRFGRDEEEPAA